MKLIITVPAYNEEKLIGNTIKEIILVKKKILKEYFEKTTILVIDDGSSDETSSVAIGAGADKIITHKKNEGLGCAFKTGIENALALDADIIVNIDADGQFNSDDIIKLVKPIIDAEADMVTCTRFANKAPKMSRVKKFGNKRFTKLVNKIMGGNFTDTQCGFRAYSREAALQLTLFGRYTYTQEVFLDLAKKGMKIIEIPCEVKGEREGESRLIKSISHYTLEAMLIVLKAYRDSKPLRFFGTLSLLTFIPGVIIALILAVRLILFHVVYPFMSLVYVSLALLFIGMMLFVLALVADMYVRQRILQEEILYRLKKENYKKK